MSTAASPLRMSYCSRREKQVKLLGTGNVAHCVPFSVSMLGKDGIYVNPLEIYN